MMSLGLTSFRRILRYTLSLGFAAFGLLGTSSAMGHELDFGVLDVSELNQNKYQFEFRYTSQQLDLSIVDIDMPSGCSNMRTSDALSSLKERTLTWVSHCKNTAESAITVPFPDIELKGVAQNQPILVRVKLKTGESLEKLVRTNPIALTNIIAEHQSEKISNSSFSYFQIGFEHILEGYDHLLVVLCFLLLFTGFATLLWVVTGFTIGHSLSLIMATWYGWQIPATVVEIFIVLSVVFMARESFVGSKSTLLSQYPVLMSSLIGLLHGLGFANVINELGLPNEQSFLAIIFFNLGVEAGQMLFVAAGLCLLWAITRLVPRRSTVTKTISLGIGTTSMVWLIQLA